MKRWCISIPGRLSPTGKRQRKFFVLKKEASEYGARLSETEQNNSKLIRKIDPQLIEDAVRFNEAFQIYGFKGFKHACETFLARLDQEQKAIGFGELLSSFEQTHQANWGHRYKQGWKTICSLMEPEKESPLSLLDKPFWRAWMDDQQQKRSWSDRSYNDFLSRLSSIWKYAVENDFIEKSPIDGIPRRRLKTQIVSILTVRQTEKILHTAWEHDREMVPYFALGIFAGLRPDSELFPLEWKDVNFEEKWIRVAFGNKTDTKRFVPIEDNLLQWLKPWTKATGGICPHNLIKRRRAIVRGKYQAPANAPEKDWEEIASWKQRDIMRHSYGSYLDGQYRDRNMVKENMGHTNFKTYNQHYRRAVTPKQAKTFWSIVPPS